ncbi:MAG: YqaJ viral recombinase family protein [Sterolibacterium sp.]|nr:YqaJ viral recombinase family protein [Sterolibacterium sp.]
MQTHAVTQGSPEWHVLRASHYTASEAAAALGCSKYQTRSDLLQQKATGITPEVSPQQQATFDRGHAAEAAARPIAESIIGEALSPVVGTLDAEGLPLLASFDGITFDGDTIWENKLWNEKLAQSVIAGELDEHYWMQIEQQLLVSGAARCLFTCSDGTEAHTVSTWYQSAPERQARLMAGWQQFRKDLADWQPTEHAAPAVAAPLESLPAVVVQVQGALTIAGNLPAFGVALKAFIDNIPSQPATDQEFADAEAACKALKKAEDALITAEDSALAQISDVELMRRTVADLKNLARTTRLATEKLVKAEKEARKTERVMAARQAFDTHVAKLQLDVKGVRLVIQSPDFGAAIKGLSSLSSIDDKLTATLIEGQAAANAVAGRVANNLQLLDSIPGYAFLFADRQELAHKETETLDLVIEKRVTEHKAAEAAKLEAERARIRAEEEVKAKAAEAAKKPEPVPAQTHAVPVANGTAQGVGAGDAISHPGKTLTIGLINDRLSPLSITAAGLAELGFQPVSTAGAGKHYRASDFPAMCRAIADVAMRASTLLEAA